MKTFARGTEINLIKVCEILKCPCKEQSKVFEISRERSSLDSEEIRIILGIECLLSDLLSIFLLI